VAGAGLNGKTGAYEILPLPVTPPSFRLSAQSFTVSLSEIINFGSKISFLT
jgi:hypothetical protein